MRSRFTLFGPLLVFVAASQSATSTPSVTIESASVSAGSRGCLRLLLANSQTPLIAAFTADVTFDASKLSSPSVSTSASGKSAQGNLISTGVYRVTVYGGTTAFADGEIATICFATTAGNCGTVSVGFAAGTPTASDANANPVAIAGLGGSLSITGCGSPASASLTIGSASTSAGSQGCLSLGLANSANPNITAFTGDITYDASGITPASTTTVVSGKVAQGNVVDTGVYRITVYGGVNAFPDGNAASVCFSTLAGRCGSFAVGFRSGTPTASDASAKPVGLTGTGGVLTVTGCGGPTGPTYFLASSAYSTGSGGAEFHSDLRVMNPASSHTTVTPTFYDQASGQTFSASPFTVPPRSQASYDNVLQSLFGRGLGSYGPIRLQAGGTLIVSSGVNNVNACGSGAIAGQWLPATDTSLGLKAGLLVQLGLSSDSTTGYRTNVVFLNPGTQASTVTATLRRGNGGIVGSTTIGPLAANGWKQVALSTFPNASGVTDTNLFVEFSADQPVLAFASVINNASGDPFAILAVADPSN